MTGINHALTGAVVAVAIGKPWLALPAAFLSHFAVDIIPHWDYKIHSLHLKRLAVGSDLLGTLLLLMVLVILLPGSSPWLVIAGGLLGVLPDTMWLPELLENKVPAMHKKTLLHLIRRIHFKLHVENSFGPYVEIAWFFLMGIVIFRIG